MTAGDKARTKHPNIRRLTLARHTTQGTLSDTNKPGRKRRMRHILNDRGKRKMKMAEKKVLTPSLQIIAHQEERHQQ